MASGWDGATSANKDASRCSHCNEDLNNGDLRWFHKIGVTALGIHVALCKDCADNHTPQTWHGCGCGG